jgi:hypothetical protein
VEHIGVGGPKPPEGLHHGGAKHTENTFLSVPSVSRWWILLLARLRVFPLALAAEPGLRFVPFNGSVA